MEEIASFFDEITKLVTELERQYGIATARYTSYAIERLEHSIIACTTVHGRLAEDSTLEDYCSMLNDLVGCLRVLYYKWEEYQDIVDSYPDGSLSYRAMPVTVRTGLGRPRFNISRDQLLYLVSLSFKWTEIAALLGVSRMTIYR